jgi:hypothetical protein
LLHLNAYTDQKKIVKKNQEPNQQKKNSEGVGACVCFACYLLHPRVSSGTAMDPDAHCLVSFPFAFPEEPCYDYGVRLLEKACAQYSVVFVCVLFKQETVEEEDYQRLINHIYLTLAQSARAESQVVVIDPSIGLSR